MTDTSGAKTEKIGTAHGPVNSAEDTARRIAALEATIESLKTNPRNLALKSACNVCGMEVDPATKCEFHPNDKTNHYRAATDEEEGSGKGKLILIKQS